MKAKYILFAAAALLLAACNKEKLEQDSYSFGLNVRNENYMEEILLKGVGEAQIVDAKNLPHWIDGVMLKDELQNNDPVAVVGVQQDLNLEDTRTANIVLTMSNGKTVSLELTQWAIIQDGTNAAYKSANSDFEKKWWEATALSLVTGNQTINGRQEVTKQTVPLPWAWDQSPICFLPKGDGRDETNEVYKMIENKGDWSLVFNLTGINALPGRNYFGLYNRYTGILRVFYYMTNDLIPEGASDHLWSFSFNSVLAEHVATQFALPRKEKATPEYLARASMPILSSPTTDAYNPLSGQTSNTLAEGWWAFDVNVAAYRDHQFFNETPRTAATIQLCTYNQQQVILNSVLQGNLGGTMKGNVNLELLRPTSVAKWAKITASVVGGLGTIASNNFFLNEACGGRTKAANPVVDHQVNHAAAPGQGENVQQNNAPAFRIQPQSMAIAITSLVVGVALSVGAKFIESAGTKKVEDKNFGALQANLNLDLNAVMATSGTISGSTPNKVPPVTMSMDYLKKSNPVEKEGEEATPTCMGEGIWNLEHHPVIYVVKDAYWYEARFTVLSTQREYQIGAEGKYVEDIYSYDLGATKGSRPGLRLITFLDPTSIGGVVMNDHLFNAEKEKARIYLSYGVYPGSAPGYSDAFRRDMGLDYPHSWRLDIRDNGKKGYTTDSLKLVKKVHTDPLFKWAEAPEALRQIVGYRLSSQKMNTKTPGQERRFFGQSCYFTDPYATDYTVDEAQFVYDPQVYVPFDDANHRLYDPQVPDFVVTAMINAYGKDKNQTEPSVLTNTLRFLPKIELVSYKDLPAILEKINKQYKEMTGPANETVFVEMKAQVDHIKDIVDATNELRPKK